MPQSPSPPGTQHGGYLTHCLALSCLVPHSEKSKGSDKKKSPCPSHPRRELAFSVLRVFFRVMFFLLCSVALEIKGFTFSARSARDRFLNKSGPQPGKKMKTTHCKQPLFSKPRQVRGALRKARGRQEEREALGMRGHSHPEYTKTSEVTEVRDSPKHPQVQPFLTTRVTCRVPGHLQVLGALCGAWGSTFKHALVVVQVPRAGEGRVWALKGRWGSVHLVLRCTPGSYMAPSTGLQPGPHLL